MPAESKAQRRLFGIVRGLQKGTVDPKSVSGEAKDLAKHISPEKADHFAKIHEKGLPEKETKSAEIEKQATLHLIKRARAVVGAVYGEQQNIQGW